ncbi:hypothetical protein ACIA8O_01075 [Kitasatospora sp. NPDC051853]|uniref:hypothetical protein n=1 Tax=Kitasatospora sp. NPDC051853 TaxID=3364058 RepID=UPI00378C2F62
MDVSGVPNAVPAEGGQGAEPSDLFARHPVMEELARLLQTLDTEAAAAAGSGGTDGTPSVERRIGGPLTGFALGRPPRSESTAVWEFAPTGESGGPEEEKTVADRRRLAARIAKATPALPLLARLLTARLLLELVARGTWPPGDRAPFALLSAAVDPLGALDPDTLPGEELEATASLAVLVLSVLDFQAADQAEQARYEHLVESFGTLILAASPERITAYTSPELSKAFGVMVDVDHVMDLANHTLLDPVTRAVEAITEAGDATAQKHSRQLLSVHGRFPDLTRAALDAIGRTELTGPVGAWAVDEASGNWTFVAWRKPDLFEVTQSGRRPGWRHFQLPPVTNPAGLARGLGLKGRQPKASGTLTQPTPIGQELLDELGLSHPFPPSEDDQPS